MPPSPIILIISYWLIRTPGCGIAAVACTPVDAPSNVSHALRETPGVEGAWDELFARALARIVGAGAGSTDGMWFIGVPAAVVDGGTGAGPFTTIVRAPLGVGWIGDAPATVRTGAIGVPFEAPTIVGSCGGRSEPLLSVGFAGRACAPLASVGVCPSRVLSSLIDL